jgi:PAS domain S-box-containing protein
MGSLFEYHGRSFAEQASEADGKLKLKSAIASAKEVDADPNSCRALNVEMISRVSKSSIPIRRRFDWTCSLRADGCVVVTGEPCLTHDIALKAQNSELMDFFENAPIAMHWLSKEGIVLWANQKELDFLGYSAEEYVGQHITKFSSNYDASVFTKLLCERKPVRDMPVRFHMKDGSLANVLMDNDAK